MSEMIERVALAIEATMFAPHELPCDAELHSKYRETARAAIEAMREPTLEMEIVAQEEWMTKRVADDRAAVIWRAMIDVALSSQERV